MRRTVVGLLAGLAALVLLTGCATVPGSSDVQVLRRVGDAAEPTTPPGPVRGAGPLETVRGWVLASGSTGDRHEAARAFLTPQAAGGWDDGAAPTVVSDQVDTVFADRAGAPGQRAVRVRANRLGTLNPEGAFVAQPGQVDLVVQLVQANGQWRISALPPGTIVRRGDLRANTRPVRAWFLDPVRGIPVAEPRYLATSPARTVAVRALQLLLAGPSAGLSGAAVSALPPGAALRTPAPTTVDGTPVVDLTRLGPLDDARRMQIAQQVGLTLAGVGVPRIRLLVDDAPLLPQGPDVALSDLTSGLPPGLVAGRDLPTGAGGSVPSGSPAALVTDGRVRNLGGDPVEGPAGTGSYDAVSAAPGDDGRLLAVIAANGPPGPAGPRVRLLAGRAGAELGPTGIEGVTALPPTWTPGGREVWTVVDGTQVMRAARDADSRPSATVSPRSAPIDASALTAAAGPGVPIQALHLSPDGIRVAAVAGGRVLVGAVARNGTGGVRIGSVEVLRPEALGGVLDVAWTRADQLVAVGSRGDRPVSFVSVDGLDLDTGPTTNLTPPVTAVAAAPGRPIVVVDLSGTWTLPSEGGDAGEVWRSVAGAGPGTTPTYSG